jgi:hypothetical protein
MTDFAPSSSISRMQPWGLDRQTLPTDDSVIGDYWDRGGTTSISPAGWANWTTSPTASSMSG